ncbi:hypothetical protein DFJ73DRAFT_631981 [Zopfochytrium polystomum]|nr:hypothetical protein DFJ73DRAFT_631981 [Zopfochytrium polystomum]
MTNADALPQSSSEPQQQQQQHHDDLIHASNADQVHTRLVAIAVDGSKHSEYAFNWAVKHFVRPESDLLLIVHARPVVNLPFRRTPPQTSNSTFATDVEEFDRKESHELLHKFAASLPGDKKYKVRLVSTLGDPREAIAAKVESEKADVLIVGSHGRGLVRKALLGSVSDHLVKHAAVPVIVARSEAAEKHTAN